MLQTKEGRGDEAFMKLQYSGHLMQRANSLEKTLMLGKIEGMDHGTPGLLVHHQLPEFTQTHVR